MRHEPDPKEILVEALLAACASDPPVDLDLFAEREAVRATIGGRGSGSTSPGAPRRSTAGR